MPQVAINIRTFRWAKVLDLSSQFTMVKTHRIEKSRSRFCHKCSQSKLVTIFVRKQNLRTLTDDGKSYIETATYMSFTCIYIPMPRRPFSQARLKRGMSDLSGKRPHYGTFGACLIVNESHSTIQLCILRLVCVAIHRGIRLDECLLFTV